VVEETNTNLGAAEKCPKEIITVCMSPSDAVGKGRR
jgi:hypothetical protein